ncbi:LPXTG-motif cell wall anchor domain-containing protein [Agrococcus jejuensis]|uniref:LPXTG-motif cell wall anchor domain-containing protein n=2 Tax=Agrococcus jejuensis TaxID=399736 RepID=A0A1G8B2Y8_9MICO|nr:LPXTG-motif cell wall anchor domain-containing protein [Agrococcus jejuensis]
MIRRALVTVGVAAAMIVGVAPVAHAAPSQTTIQGDVLRLVSIQDRDAMRAMVPGVPTAWDVGVSANRADGDITVRLEVDATDDAFAATVRWCAVAWTADGCATGATLLSDATLADGALTLAEQPAGESRWYRIEVRLVIGIGDHAANLVFRALGMGDDVASGGDVELPRTGLGVPGLGFALAGAAVASGVLVAVVARRRRREEVAS